MTDPLTETLLFDRVAILGLGLIGGSLAKAIKTAKLANHVVAFDQDEEQLKLGLDSGVIDEGCDSCLAAVEGASLIVLAVPVMAVATVMAEIKSAVDQKQGHNQDVIMTDVGSVKGYVINAAAAVFGEVPANFIAGHPVAGSEKHGVRASDATLFRHHQVILTPIKTSNPVAVEKIEALWLRTGATVVKMEPEHHDQVLAQTSHLPHLLAYGLIDTLSTQGDSLEIFEYAAGGLRDFSRIAASDPIMWRDIFKSNSQAVLSILTEYQQELSDLRGLIENEDFDQLSEVFARSKRARDHFSEVLARRAAKS